MQSYLCTIKAHLLLLIFGLSVSGWRYNFKQSMNSYCFCTHLHLCVCVLPEAKAATAVFNSDQAAKATAGPKPQIQKSAGGGSEGGLAWPRSVWFSLSRHTFQTQKSSVMV